MSDNYEQTKGNEYPNGGAAGRLREASAAWKAEQRLSVASEQLAALVTGAQGKHQAEKLVSTALLLADVLIAAAKAGE